MTLEAAVVVGIVSLAGNVYQYIVNKKGKDLDAIKKELELLQQLQKAKDKAYEEALRVKDLQIKDLTDKMNAQSELLVKCTGEVEHMRKIVTFLIANGCQDANTCLSHNAYSIDDLNKLVSPDSDLMKEEEK